VAEWVDSNTYGEYQITADVLEWYRVEETETQASFGNMGNIFDGVGTLEDILLPALTHAGDTYDLTDYADNFGHLTGIIFVHSGYAAEQGGVDEDGASYMDRIASKAWAVDIELQDGIRLQTFATVSALKGTSGEQMAGIGNHLHEWLHVRFGLHDLHDLGGRYNNSTVATGGIGAFGIMSYAEGPGYQEEFPGILNPYYKLKIGALEDVRDIDGDGTYLVGASSLQPDIFRIQAPYPPGEYLLIENRQPVGSDRNIWAPGGIVIYHIDETADGNKVRGGPFVDGWPGNGAHYEVAVLQADGKYELEQALNLGDANDYWKEGDELGPGNGELVATNEGVYPNTDSYQEGNIEVTGLVINNFKANGGCEWSFEVSNLVARDNSGGPPSLVITPVRCPNYSADLYPGSSFECDCKADCDPSSDRHFFCKCEEGTACCALSNAPSETPGEPSIAPSITPSIAPSEQPSIVSNPPTTSTQPSNLSNNSTGPKDASPITDPLVQSPSAPTPASSPQGQPPPPEEESTTGSTIGIASIGLIVLGAIGYIGFLEWKKKGKGGNQSQKNIEDPKTKNLRQDNFDDEQDDDSGGERDDDSDDDSDDEYDDDSV